MVDRPILRKERRESTPEYTIQQKYFNLIKDGSKTVEGRINSGGFANLRAGNDVIFINSSRRNEKIKCSLTETQSYPTFRAMLEAEGVTNMLPDITDLDEGVRVYERIPSYAQRCKKSGCLALRIGKVEEV